MTVSIEELAKKIPKCCHAKQCSRDKCKVRLDNVPFNRLIIDMDCKALGIDNETRCDFLFVGKENNVTWIALIELKSGGIDKVAHLAAQLLAGAKLITRLLPSGISPNATLQFVPVLVRGKKSSMRKNDKCLLYRKKIQILGVNHKIKTIRSGEQLPIGSNFI